MKVWLVVRDDAMLNEPTYGNVTVAAFSSKELAQQWIDDKNITASRKWSMNTYDPRYYPFPYSIEEWDVDEHGVSNG